MKNVFGLQPKLGTKAYHIWRKNRDYYLKLRKEARSTLACFDTLNEKGVQRFDFVTSTMLDLTLGKFHR